MRQYPKFSFSDLLTLAAQEKMGVLALISALQGVVAELNGDCSLLNRLTAAKTLAIRIGHIV